MKQILIIILPLLLYSCSSNNGDTINHLTIQLDTLNKRLYECHLPELNGELYYSAYEIFKNSTQERQTECYNNIRSCPCDQIAKMKTFEDFQKIEGCFLFERID